MKKTVLITLMILLNVLVMSGQMMSMSGQKTTINGITYGFTLGATTDGCIIDCGGPVGASAKGVRTNSDVTILEKVSITGIVYKVEVICSSAFESNHTLERIHIPKSIISIGSNAFYDCSLLKEITIPNSVKVISNYAFCGCISLNEIIIPKSVERIGSDAFTDCSSLKKITIPNSVKEIGKYAFLNCNSLKEIIIPNSLKEIQSWTFADCSSLEKIVIPESVTSIANNAFEGCKNLKEVVFATDLQRTKFAGVFPRTAKLTVNFNPSAPPSIDFVANSIQFVDANGNNAIDAEEKCTIRLQVTNSGKGDARNCVAKITSATIPGVTYNNVDIPQIKAGETKTVEIPLTANLQTQNGTAKFTIQVNEPNGFGTDEVSLSVNTRAFDAPMLRVVDYATVSADGSSVLAKKSAFDLQILLQNVDTGKAENVQVSIEVPENVFLMDTQNQKTFKSIDGGDTKKIIYSLIANNNYASNSIPVKVNVKEKHGKYAENRIIDLPLNQTLKNHNIVLEEKSDDGQGKDIQIASIGSDVDKNIPSSTVRNDRTFAVIIANENYNKEANVPYAVNDGSVFSEYCSTTLGVPTSNIHLVRNATLNDIRHEVNWITNVMDASGGKAKVLFYYAGHGIPDEKTRTAYLLPVDGYGSDVTTGYPLTTLYSALGETPSQSVTVFLDACFSGTKREGDMMASARGVAIKVNETSPVGNMVVFSAAQGDETAYPYTEQGHGLFTYYLLKKLQDTEGNVTLGDLSDYVIEQVKLQSVVINSKPQTPSVIPSPNMSDSWRSETLK